MAVIQGVNPITNQNLQFPILRGPQGPPGPQGPQGPEAEIDSADVDAAGAVMNTDASTAAMSFVIDEDTMTSDSATKVPTQQSVKTYVDANGGSGISDIVEDTTPQLGGSLDLNTFTVGDADAADLTKLSEVTATSTELNALDGITASVAELNILDGVTATASELNALDGITATVTELNYTDGVTSAIQTQLDAKQATISGLTASGAELNILDGATLSTTELNYVDGVTSAIQAQIDGKQPLDSDLTTIAGLADPNADRILFWDDSTGAYAYLTPSTGLTVTTTSLTVRTASATQTGIVELATTAETTTGTDTARAVTPDGLHDMTSLAGASWFLDEDDMTSDSATQTASQQSIKAYVDTKAPLVSPTLTGTTTVTDLVINESATYDAEADDGNSSTADTIDWGVGNVHKSTMTGDATYTFTAPAGAAHLTLKLVQDGTGSRNPTWPATVKWAGGVEPTWSTGASSIDIATFYYDGTNYFGAANTGFA